jgi:hypothetical protein
VAVRERRISNTSADPRMSNSTHRCPAGHEERLPYRCDSLSWCDRCAAMVQFTRIAEIPSRIAAMPPWSATRTPKPAKFPVKPWRPYKD